MLAEGYSQAGSIGTLSAFAQTADTSAVTRARRAVLEFASDDPSAGQESTSDTASVEVYVVPGAQGYVPHQVAAGDTLTSVVDNNDWSDVATVATSPQRTASTTSTTSASARCSASRSRPRPAPRPPRAPSGAHAPQPGTASAQSKHQRHSQARARVTQPRR